MKTHTQSEEIANLQKPKRANPPRKIWLRSLANGRISVGEYIRGKRFNIVPALRIHPHMDDAEVASLRATIDAYEKRENRFCVAVIPHGDFNAKHVADVLTIPLES